MDANAVAHVESRVRALGVDWGAWLALLAQYGPKLYAVAQLLLPLLEKGTLSAADFLTLLKSILDVFGSPQIVPHGA